MRVLSSMRPEAPVLFIKIVPTVLQIVLGGNSMMQQQQDGT
jgi:hypothetical protein